MAPLLALRSVSKAFGSLRVIDDLSVSVEPGEALGVIGPNGAGKTTALNLLIGRLRPERGAVVFAERDVTMTPPHARCRAGIALTHQIPHPFEALTVFENVLVGGIFGGGRAERLASAPALAALALAGLAGRANTRAGTLTLLERKRLELARALATAPRVLLLDEIAGGLGGHPAHDLVARGVVMVPEGRRIFPSLTVEENLRVGAYRGRSGPWTLARVYELFPVLAERRGQPGPNLSGGEQQMLAIGRGLMANPRLLLVDEISLGLAPIVVRGLYRVLRTIAAEGTTTLVVDQDVSQVMELARRVYCFRKGSVSLEGPPAELTRDRLSAAYFGV